MKRYLYSLLLILFPLLAHAAAMTFTPPPTDVSVIFLGNIFGVVDGVLHGSGSQIMGAMFGVFNAAVLALGGIIIIYTLMVSTLNTAHEGQMLGQKWSSIWVPIRSTLGLALLIPKASGYCLMQIFVMWVVIQGVGAADKIWDAALSYLNRGGVIIQQQVNPLAALTGGGINLYKGASAILTGQVCMLGVERVLTKRRDALLKLKQNGSGDCFNPQPNTSMKAFCDGPIPDFLSTVNAINYFTLKRSGTEIPTGLNTIPMPNFPSEGSPLWYQLNGMCGTLNWDNLNPVQVIAIDNAMAATAQISNERETAQNTRAIAVQQMYSDLSTVAQIMVDNDPQLTASAAVPTVSSATPTNTTNPNPPVANWAQISFGVPFNIMSSVCTTNDNSCVTWGADTNMGALLTGMELHGAVSDYNNVMLPTLVLIDRSLKVQSSAQQRTFLKDASLRGWMMAGSYFFNLATINSTQSTTGSGGPTGGAPIDTDAGLEKSSPFKTSELYRGFDTASNSCNGYRDWVCAAMGGDTSLIKPVADLINGGSLSAPTIPLAASPKVYSGAQGSSVYGFISNSLFVQPPQQAGTVAPKFIFRLIPSFEQGDDFSFPDQPFSCGKIKIMFPFSFCFIQWMGHLLYDFFVKFLFSFLLQIVAVVINMALMAFLSLPLQGMSEIFQKGVSYIKEPNVNPIVALAYMGVNYINFSMKLWIYLIVLAIQCALFPIVGIFIFALIALAAPLVLAWISIMVGIGFTTAYYIPFVPYLIFTFGSIAWLMAVVEAMVAAPIVALGITHPEGEGPFGKGEQAIMVLMNVFLRPALMIIGYIAGIILSYVSVWVINAGFANVLTFMQGTNSSQDLQWWPTKAASPNTQQAQTDLGFGDWAGAYGFFFSILVYTTTYLAVVQKAFTLISSLPDKVLRWIGGQPESIGQEAAQWGEEVKKHVEAGAQATQKAGGQMSKQLGGYATKAISKVGGSGGSKVE